MLDNETTQKTAELLSSIDYLYISNKFFEMTSQSSCDCDEIVIKNGNQCILLTSHSFGEDGYLETKELTDYEQNKFIYYVEREQLRRSQDDKVGLKEK